MGLKIKYFFIAGAVLTILALFGELNAANIEIGEMSQANTQLEATLMQKDIEHNEAIQMLVEQRQLNQRLQIELDQAFESIELKSRDLNHALFKLSQNNKVVNDWLNTPVPIDVIRLRLGQNGYGNEDKNSQRATAEKSGKRL